MNEGSLTAETHRRLRSAIIQGDIRPNARLYAIEIAEKLDVSRTPVREALQLLSSEGLIVPARRGYIVYEHSREEIREVYEVRAALEGLASRLAAELAIDEDIEKIADIGAHISGVLDTERQIIVDRNDLFHKAIVAASGNNRLARINELNSEQFFTYRVARMYTEEEAANAVREHEAILDAIRHRDPDEAERLTQLHVKDALRITLSKLF